MLCLSVISHGQHTLAMRLLGCIARDRSPLVTRIVYTRNLPEAPLPPSITAIPGLEVIDNAAPLGFGRNHNQAFGRCQEPFFCVLNPDIEWEHDPFPALLACFDAPTKDPGLGLVAPLVRSPAGAIENTARRLYTPAEMLAQKRRPRNAGANADWLAGMFLLFGANAWRNIGGFDERYHLYIEDVDICTRLRLAGWQLAQCDTATVVHDAQNQSHRSLRYTGWHLRGMLRYWTSPTFWRYRKSLLQLPEHGQVRERR